jgi:hypothetical protein
LELGEGSGRGAWDWDIVPNCQLQFYIPDLEHLKQRVPVSWPCSSPFRPNRKGPLEDETSVPLAPPPNPT